MYRITTLDEKSFTVPESLLNQSTYFQGLISDMGLEDKNKDKEPIFVTVTGEKFAALLELMKHGSWSCISTEMSQKIQSKYLIIPNLFTCR